MKKIYLFITTILCGLNLFGQIPNGSFETWTVNAWSNPQPQGWYVQTTPVNCTAQYTAAYQGLSACKLESFYWMGKWVDTYVTTGTTSTGYYVPMSNKPTKLFGWYMYQSFLDSLTFSISVKSAGNVIGTGAFSTINTATAYTQFTANINYTSTAVPDSFRIILSINHARPLPQFNAFGNGGSYFIVDDLKFDTNVGIHENNFSSSIKTYPNPTNDFLVFQNVDNSTQISSIEIFDVKGQLIKKHFTNEKIFELNVRDYNSGLYFYKITDNAGNTKTEKFIKQ